MKASIKLRDDDRRPSLLRAKVPVSVLSLPFVASFAAGDPSDLSFSLLTSFPSLPSLKISYHPNPSPSPFTFTLKSGAGPLGSPLNSPLQISLHLSSNPNPTFTVRLSPRLGHFSLTNSATSYPNPNPKENGGTIYGPIPMEPPLDTATRGFPHARLSVRTAVPVGPRAGLRVRWAVRLPDAATVGSSAWGRLPYLTVDKISVERNREIEEEEEEEGKRESGEKDLEAMKGMCFLMGREVEELRKENDSMRESVEALKKKFSERRGIGASTAIAAKRA